MAKRQIIVRKTGKPLQTDFFAEVRKDMRHVIALTARRARNDAGELSTEELDECETIMRRIVNRFSQELDRRLGAAEVTA